LERLAQGKEMDLLTPEVDLSARIVYFPVRHNSPACAWHVRKLIEEIRPDSVLIEGPRDATPLIPLLIHEKTRMPVAIYTTYVRKTSGADPERHAAYYPLCDYSPELAAIRAANEIGAQTSFIDLTFPECIEACKKEPDIRIQSMLDERYLKHSRFLQAACQKAGLRDPDDLWDHLYEDDYRQMDTARLIRNVLAYCALARHEHTPDMLATDGCTAREATMAARIEQESGRVVVVTGGFHTVALPTTHPKAPREVKTTAENAQVVLVRYGFEQLDRLNGYASGMPCPEFYQRMWEGRETAEIIVQLGREIRKHGLEVSADDEISALAHSKRLAALRGHKSPSREDLLDGIRSVFIKGSVDVEGVFILSTARKLLAGDRTGEVPPDAGQPPIVTDFRETAEKLKLVLDQGDVRTVTLDLYRKIPHRETSRFFFRLKTLSVPFAEWLRGPDFVSGENLDRMQEVWRYRWTPACESELIEKSLYGPTLEEASAALLLQTFKEAEDSGQGRRADIAAALLLSGCRMGLHKYTQDLLQRTAGVVAEDSGFASLIRAITSVLILHTSREPLEAHHLSGLLELATTAFERACYLLPKLSEATEEDEQEVIDALNTASLLPTSLGDLPDHKELLHDRLRQLIGTTGGNAAVRGGACGLLYAEGIMQPDELVAKLQGHLSGAANQGIDFLRGLLRTARSALWQVPEIVESVTELLGVWDEDSFVRQLPNLRLAFSDLTPRECDRVAESIAKHLGIKPTTTSHGVDFLAEDMYRAVELNRRVMASLEDDGLADWLAEKEN
jgi:hypothetical protein